MPRTIRALPGLNSYARGFYKENCENATDTAVSLLEEPAMLDALIRSRLTIPPTLLKSKISEQVGSAGDQVLIYSEHGIIWLRYVIPAGGAIADKYILFDAQGCPIVDNTTIEYVQEVCPDVAGFQIISATNNAIGLGVPPPPLRSEDSDQIVEVREAQLGSNTSSPPLPSFLSGGRSCYKKSSHLPLRYWKGRLQPGDFSSRATRDGVRVRLFSQLRDFLRIKATPPSSLIPGPFPHLNQC